MSMSTNNLSNRYLKSDANKGSTLCHEVVTVFAERGPEICK